ncbi:MAG: NUDIX hydrolase [Planctomycetota bacterium]|nr:NUDIX hydrolase [Planctomycetota bacterium]MDA1113351.1 NUDIX hydrolase [Planctomycetota bacterium]
MAKRWKKHHSKTHGNYRIFSVREDFYTHPDKDGERSFFVIEASDWVNVIAVTEDDEIVVIRQHRPGIGAVRLEIPGGIIEPGEKPIVAAVRELGEETGYRGDAPELICSVEPNPATHNNHCFSYLVRNAKREIARDLDHDEVIDVELLPFAELSGIIEAGKIPHALLQLPLLHYLRWRETGRESAPTKKTS